MNSRLKFLPHLKMLDPRATACVPDPVIMAGQGKRFQVWSSCKDSASHGCVQEEIS